MLPARTGAEDPATAVAAPNHGVPRLVCTVFSVSTPSDGSSKGSYSKAPEMNLDVHEVLRMVCSKTPIH